MNDTFVERLYDVCDKLNLKKPDSFICVSIEQQTLYYYQKSILAATFTISTSSYFPGDGVAFISYTFSTYSKRCWILLH